MATSINIIESDASPTSYAGPQIAVKAEKVTIVQENLTNYYLQQPLSPKPFFGQKAFKERKLKIHNLEYERNGSEPGRILIFHHETFADSDIKKRSGSRRDVNEVIICFQRCGFNISEDDIFQDKTTDEVLEIIANEASKDYTDYNSLIVFYFTHGDTNESLHTKDATITVMDIWKPFDECASLKNKPKLFFLQACKGHKSTTVEKPPNIEEFIPRHYFSIQQNMPPDMLVVYSTLDNSVSFRNGLTGSWFIQELCKNIHGYGKRDDILSLLIRTTKCVCANYYYEKHSSIQKQLPLFVSTLRRKFYLNTNKDRHMILHVIESNEEILKKLKIIGEKLDKLLNK